MVPTTEDSISFKSSGISVPQNLNADAALSAIAEVAAQTTALPIGLVTYLTRHRQLFLGRHGTAMTGTPVDQAFCVTTVGLDAPLVVPDSRLDHRFRNNPMVVGEPGFQFYAGAPIVLDSGQRTGSVCVLDVQPRHDFSPDMLKILANLAQAAGRIISDHIRSDEARRSALEKQHQAEAASRAKSVFIATMSHELRTPLNAVIGFTEILDAELFGPLGNIRYKAYTADILESSRHLLGLIEDILAISRIDADGPDFHPEPIDLGDEALWCLHLLRTKAAANRITINDAIGDDPLPVVADRQRCRQVLLNILGNAVKYTPTGGVVALSGGVHEDHAAIAIADTGVGIDDETLQMIGEPFTRALSAEKSATPGSGLGLALSKRLMQGMAGELHIESEVNAGTTVTLNWPRHSDPA